MIIGITGPSGAGKDTSADYLAAVLDAPHASGGDVLRDMLRAIGLPPKKSAIGDFGTFLRTHYGPAVVPERAIQKFADAKNIIVSGFRSPAEAQYIKDQGGVIIYIQAPDTVRHQRISERQREHEDTSAEFLQKLDQQEHSSTQPMAENLELVRDLSDEVVSNDGSLDELHYKLDDIVAKHVR
jgi:dephospho-CoA kinase